MGSRWPNVETDPLAEADLATHAAKTTSVHGIPDTSVLVVQSDLAAHAADTTSIHGIADTSVLLVQADLAAHSADTTGVHGIADTSLLVLQADLAAHAADTTDVHGTGTVVTSDNIGTYAPAPDLSGYATTSALAAHEADTTAIHGIADTSTLVLTSDARLSDQRVPTNGSVTDAKVAAGAAIAYSKLNLAGQVVLGDLAFDPATQAELDASAGTLVALAPTTTTRNLIQASGANPTKLTIKGTTSQGSTAPLEVQNSGGTVLGSIDQNGNLNVSNNVNLPVAGTVAFGAGATINRNSGTGVLKIGLQNLSGASFLVDNSAGNAATIPLIVKAAASQSGSLQEWRASDNSVLTTINPTGDLTVRSATTGQVVVGAVGPSSEAGISFRNTVSPRIYATTDGATGSRLNLDGSDGTLGVNIVQGVLSFGNNGTIQRISADGDLRIDPQTFLRINKPVAGATASAVPLTIRGRASQSANLLELQNSTPTTVLKVDATGILTAGGSSGSQLSANQLNFSNTGTPGFKVGGVQIVRLVQSGSAQVVVVGDSTPTVPTISGYGVMLQNVTTAPSTDPVGGGILYSEAGALKWRGTSGTVTTLAVA